MLNHLDLNLLRVFLSVAETGSFTVAARHLHSTQSTISQRIARLEQQLDRRLLERGTRTTRLTKDGEIVLRYAQQIEELRHELRTEFTDEYLTGEVRLSVPEDFLDAGFADVLAHFKRVQPRVKVEIWTGLAAQQNAWIEAGEVDLAVIRSVNPEAGKEGLWSERILWVGSQKVASELARNRHRSISLICAPSPCLYRETAIKALSSNSLHWNVSLSSPHLVGILTGVAAGLGVAPVPECGLPNDCLVLDSTHGLPELPDCHLFVRHRDGIDSNDAVEALEELICQYRWLARGDRTVTLRGSSGHAFP